MERDPRARNPEPDPELELDPVGAPFRDFDVCDREGCGRPYLVGSRVGRCGDCGFCPKHCPHVEDIGEWDPDAAPLRDLFVALMALPPCPSCGSTKGGFASPDNLRRARCLDCQTEWDAALGDSDPTPPLAE